MRWRSYPQPRLPAINGQRARLWITLLGEFPSKTLSYRFEKLGKTRFLFIIEFVSCIFARRALLKFQARNILGNDRLPKVLHGFKDKSWRRD